MQDALINWYRQKHRAFVGENAPLNASQEQLMLLQHHILEPLSQLGELNSQGNRICKRDGAACDF
ncbi:hypothetical protein VHARVF571_180023 [Vibrio harveyi]|uniref:hypothetical protein n=1 Tax=Vibrio harveyi TaxID=669 RepID=UPI002893B2F7|nr:hypothetical protein VHARVF571_180023 [Vibrio harveyi]